ncbi:MAG: hypothetical protein Q9188_001995 [Gyalolechia gomerana]
MTQPSYPAFNRGKHWRNGNNADSLRNEGRHEQAAILLRENLAMSSKYFSEHDLTVLSDRDSLSDCLHELGDYEGAIKLDEVTLPIRQRIDKEGEDTVATLQSLSDNLRQIEKHEKAIPLYRSALASRIKTLGRKHEATLETKHNLASSLYESGQVREASRLNAQILKVREEQLAADDDDLIATRHNLATNYHALGYLEQAAQLTNQNLLALQNTRTSNDAQLLEISKLQDRINSTIREAKRAQAIRVERMAQLATRQEPGFVSGNQVETRAQVSELKAAQDTSQKQTKVAKPQEGEVQARTDAEVSRVEPAAKVGTNKRRDENQERNVKSLTARADAVKHHSHQKAEVPNQQPDARADYKKEDTKAGADLGPRYNKKGAMSTMAGPNPSQRPGTAEVNGPKPEMDSKARKINFRSETPKLGSDVGVGPYKRETKSSNTKPEAELTKHKSDSSIKPKSREVDTLKPEGKEGWAKESRKDAKTYQTAAEKISIPHGVPNSSSSGRKQSAEMTRNAQQPQDGTEPFRGRSFSDPKFKEVRPEMLHTASDKMEKKTNKLLSVSSPPNAENKVRPRSSDEQSASRLKSPTLSAPIIDKPRSRSIGAVSQELSTMQARSHAFRHMCDTRGGELYNHTSRLRSGWFDRFQETQSLVARSRKAKGSRVKIAILDSGIDLNHPHFGKIPENLGAVDQQQQAPRRHRVKECKSFVREAAADCDSGGHGTHCAALLLDLSPNANIYAARVYEEGTKSIDPEVVAKAIMYAADQWKVAIITMSFGWPQRHRAVEDAIDHANRRRILICAAASNDGANDGVAFPANFSPVICVNSTNEQGKPSSFTPIPQPLVPNFAVPGENVQAAWPGLENGKSQSGTSTATPILAAVMALVLEFVDQKPRKTPDEERLRDHRVMTKVLIAMSDEVEGYRYVRPWKLMGGSNVDRGRVESRIQDAIGS